MWDLGLFRYLRGDVNKGTLTLVLPSQTGNAPGRLPHHPKGIRADVSSVRESREWVCISVVTVI